MLERGADIHAKDKNDKTALHWAVRGDHKAVIALLVEKGVGDITTEDSHHYTPLGLALARGDQEMVAILLNDAGQTALHWAVRRGHKAVVALLVEKRADIAAEDSHHNTPLDLALERGDQEMVEILLSSTNR